MGCEGQWLCVNLQVRPVSTEELSERRVHGAVDLGLYLVCCVVAQSEAVTS